MGARRADLAGPGRLRRADKGGQRSTPGRTSAWPRPRRHAPGCRRWGRTRARPPRRPAGPPDSERDQLRYAPGYARACGLTAFLVAFEDDLYTSRSGLHPGDYTAAIAR
ncbi:hypothetical protein [Actinomycetospora sp.]|uniref:hypothetical protein n=1 Tax=Actinomycetospora sp. TaxID=1872135 RepID=UPI002F418D78